MIPLSEIGYDVVVCWLAITLGYAIARNRRYLIMGVPALAGTLVHKYQEQFGTQPTLRHAFNVADTLTSVTLVLGVIVFWCWPMIKKRVGSGKVERGDGS